MKTKHKIWIKISGITFLLVILVLMSITFFTAYFNESKTYLIEINNYGEAPVEFVLLIFGIVVSSWASYLIFNETMDLMIKEKVREEN